jgi:hypothetical protein
MITVLKIVFFLFLGLIVLIICVCDSNLLRDLIHSSKKIDKKHVNEDSFQRYAKFYGNVIPNEEKFDERLSKILDLIVNKKVYDINLIAEKSYCNLTECILKIRYLKNKRLIGDFYIDTVNNLLVPCSAEDQILIEKYKPYIYNSHLQINEIAGVIHNPDGLSVPKLMDVIFKELNYLDEKGLLNGIRIDDVDKNIIYYSVEKKKKSSDLVTVHCSNCGALNDVNVDGKVYCAYCKNIIKGKDYID